MINPIVMISILTALAGGPQTMPGKPNVKPKPTPPGGSTIVRTLPADLNGTTDNVSNTTNNIADNTLDNTNDANMDTYKNKSELTKENKDILFDTNDMINTKLPEQNKRISTLEDNAEYSADAEYLKRKSILDARFNRMFQLKLQLDANQAMQNEKWDEYYSLRDSYQKQLKKLIADWVTDTQYNAI